MQNIDISKLPPPPPGKTGWPWTESSSNPPALMDNGSDWPRISIVTPSYNQGQFIEETIRSVLLQGYPNLEYIIIDGASKDDSIQIIKKYENFLSYWVSEPDQGQTYAISKGIQHATGSLLNWLNSDDILLPGSLYAIAQSYIRENKTNCVLCGNAYITSIDGKKIKESIVSDVNPDELICPTYPPLGGGIQASWFFSNEAWRTVGGIDLKLNFRMDTDLYIRFNEAGCPFVPVNFPVAAYRTHPDTKTRKGWKENFAYKKAFYKKELAKVNEKERILYEKRIKRVFFGNYLNSISINDNFGVRLFKIASAFLGYPNALRSPYQLKRSLKLLFFPPADVTI
ncbi:MAG: glycosyltransferase [Anaerolineales bacterium]|nr:glycosyltransferase [Anaerolineales bacterium]